ncbi:PVC-type heme-binding CxxCH protein [Haloferula chungangensis]|uniref:PVC-type heme-binding CxxCH protein n=1 Tax=Haloferula chungangensis TaxID=1048331 RepID=A0ABW2L9A5_9BACT
MRPLLFLIPAISLAAEFPTPTNSETEAGSPMPAEEVAAKTLMPDGFNITVFASEPQVQNPIDCSWDSQGRMWVAENFTYERLGTNHRDDFRDRVILLKDSTGDGKADQRQVFTDTLSNLTSLEWTPQGLWVMCPPKLLFIPDENRDAIPDSEPQVILDGFTVPKGNHHNFANGLRIGPDGWLYGRCGGSAPGEVGKPGTPEAERLPLRGGVWRYHRSRGTFEVIASGTTNPWGHDWDENGNLFIINTVNDHLFHVVPGMHLARLLTAPANPRIYEAIPGHADHWHFDTSGKWNESRDGVANDFGGGHAHVGMMIYQGTNWPAEYRGKLFTLNLHGRRINQEILKPKGSGFVATHGEDLFITPDPFFRGVELTQGPHGEVYVLDWSDTGECHENTGVHRTSGRIYMITYAEYRSLEIDLSKVKSGPLLREHQDTKNSWVSRMNLLELEHRIKIEELPDREHSITNSARPLDELRLLQDQSLWTFADPPFEGSERGRNGIVAFTDNWPLDSITSQRIDTPEAVTVAKEHLLSLIRTADYSPQVRLTLASTLQRLPIDLRKDLAIALVSHAEDADDHNLPLLVWYGLIPVADAHPEHLVEIFAACEWPKLRQFIARRLTEDLDTKPDSLNALLRSSIGARTSVRPGAPVDIILGMQQALAGWQSATPPPAWLAFSQKIESKSIPLANALRDLNTLFNTGRPLDEIEAIARDPKAPLDARQSAVRALIRAKPDNLKKLLLSLLDVRQLNVTAATGLAHFDDPKVAQALLAKLRKFHSTEQDQILGILCSRPAFARVLLERIESNKLPAKRLSAFHARQIDSLGDEALSTQLRKLWGTSGLSDDAKKQLIESTRQKLSEETLALADLTTGAQLYQTHCAVCHKLHGQGGEIGPDLTGGGRSNLDYLLHNIIDPSAELAPDYRMEIFTLTDGRVLTGVVKEQSPKTLTIQTMTTREPIERSRIKSRQLIETSLMPEGLLNGLSDEQTRDLFGYLMHPTKPN